MFSCLLVCQPAIFVDSKRDGTGAAHGRKGFRMKRAELDRRIANGETFFGKRGLVLQHGEDDVSSFTLNPSWLSCEDETQRCIMVEIYLEP